MTMDLHAKAFSLQAHTGLKTKGGISYDNDKSGSAGLYQYSP